MGQRINALVKGQNVMKAMYGLGIYLAKSLVKQKRIVEIAELAAQKLKPKQF
ncbi:hypothetical protein [Pedobacter foliorum]|uniref:hypothetical protein n=1 Tax=Pedobacter foliorum TaxID=2739058 RepID=UPI0015659830|nr:hypothetical protein [Pedobacter foliorum]NRF41095.1 hypothetical protein [Pedobacter foliorum]